MSLNGKFLQNLPAQLSRREVRAVMREMWTQGRRDTNDSSRSVFERALDVDPRSPDVWVNGHLNVCSARAHCRLNTPTWNFERETSTTLETCLTVV
jgi:hypothetical protein